MDLKVWFLINGDYLRAEYRLIGRVVPLQSWGHKLNPRNSHLKINKKALGVVACF